MEKPMICVDTSVLIDYFRKKNKSESLFYSLTNQYDIFAVSAITEFEIYIGSNPKQDEYWDDFFSRIIVLPYETKVNKIAISINRLLKKKSKQIDVPDLIIAATAKVNELKLATLNSKHFSIIDGLNIVTNNK